MIYVDDDTNVGVGNTSPQHKLDVSGAIYSRLASASSSAIDWNQGNVQVLSLSSSPSLTFDNGQAGGEYKLVLTQDATGSRTVTWPASVKWPGGSAPTLTTTAGYSDVLSFIFDGNRYLGSSALNYASSLALDLVSYWKLDEGSGDASDSYGSNTLTNNGSMTYSSALINNGADTTTSAYLSIADASQAGLDFSTDLTFAGWVKFSATPGAGDRQTMIGKFASFGHWSYAFSYENDTGGKGVNLQLNSSSDGTSQTQGYGIINSNTPLTTGAWYFFAVTKTGGTTTFYFQGAAATTSVNAASSFYNSDAVFTLGRENTSSAQAVQGQMDEWGVWNRALSASEITQLYNSGSGRQYPF